MCVSKTDHRGQRYGIRRATVIGTLCKLNFRECYFSTGIKVHVFVILLLSSSCQGLCAWQPGVWRCLGPFTGRQGSNCADTFPDPSTTVFLYFLSSLLWTPGLHFPNKVLCFTFQLCEAKTQANYTGYSCSLFAALWSGEEFQDWEAIHSAQWRLRRTTSGMPCSQQDSGVGFSSCDFKPNAFCVILKMTGFEHY